jgi:flagellar hook-associated protein 3 FlgL
MTVRITNQMMFNNALINIFRQNEGLLRTQEQLASGKRVNRPSDDPFAMMSILSLRTEKQQNEQFVKNNATGTSVFNLTDSILDEANSVALRAKELGLQATNGTETAQTRLVIATEIDQLINEAIQIGNRQSENRYLFGGQNTTLAPVTSTGSYAGSPNRLQFNIGNGSRLEVGVLASEFLTADMNPDIHPATPLSELNKGAGASGTFTLTDRAGNSANVTVGSANTIGDVINFINGSGNNLTAAISADGTGLTITDSTAVPIQSMSITDVSGTATVSLGIAGTRAISSFTGNDLDPVVTAGTPLTALFGGNGLIPTDINIVNGAASATVTFAGAVTVGDLINAINASGANVTASLDSLGTRLVLTSNSASTVAYAVDLGTGKTADLLGIGGGRNLISTLKGLSAALKANDVTGILGAVGNLDTNLGTIEALRGEAGSRAARISLQEQVLESSRFDIDVRTGELEGANVFEAASELALIQSALQATLSSTAAIIQPTLLDFLR